MYMRHGLPADRTQHSILMVQDEEDFILSFIKVNIHEYCGHVSFLFINLTINVQVNVQKTGTEVVMIGAGMVAALEGA